jgi:RNA polymerase sigma-70 factor (ECF subfamily)
MERHPMPESDAAAPWWFIEGDESQVAVAPAAAEPLLVQLFDQLRSPLLRYLLSLGISLEDAEEVIQEAFLALFAHLRSGKSRRNLRGWIFRVAHNIGLKRRLAARRHASSSPIDEVAANWIDPEKNPEEQLLSNQRQQRLEGILRALPDRDRWCLALRAEGLRYREIAEILDISLGSVAASVARSLGRLSAADG